MKLQKRKLSKINWFNLILRIMFILGLSSITIVFIFSILNGWWLISIICGVLSIFLSIIFKWIFQKKVNIGPDYECIWDAKSDGRLDE